MAIFPKKTYTLTASAGGAISSSGAITVNQGASQTFTFVPNTGYEIEQLRVDGQTLPNSGSSYTFTNITENHTIAVTFKEVVGVEEWRKENEKWRNYPNPTTGKLHIVMNNE